MGGMTILQSEQIGVGVIGIGFVGGQAHTPAFRKIPGSRLVGLADKDERRVKLLSLKYGIKYFLDPLALIQDPDVNAVVVATPTPTHYRIVKDALQNGKHVLCEMPIAPTLREVEELRDIAEKSDVIFMPDLNLRFTPNYVKMKELLDQGVIGKPTTVCFRELIPAKDLADQWPAGSWAWNTNVSGGYPDFTLSVWSIDLLRWLFDAEYSKVTWESTYTPLREYGGIVGYSTLGLIKMLNGVVGSLFYSCFIPPDAGGTTSLEVYGEKAYGLHATWNDSLTLIGENPAKQEWKFRVGGTKVWGHYQIDKYFVECIIKGVKPQITIEDALKAQEITSKMV